MNPLISIGMPVYNEELYIEASVNSILAQKYDPIELIVSDNASTDNTEQICLDLAKRDKRIKYVRNHANLGAIANFCKVFDYAKGEYFMFAGGHDLWSPNVVTRCLETLQANPSTVLAFPTTAWIDDVNRPITRETPYYDTRGFDVVSRHLFVLWGPMNPVYGLIRTDALKKTRLHLQMIGGDLIILTELSFMGSFACVQDAVWYRRMKEREESRQEKIKRYKNTLFSASGILSKPMSHLKIPFELFKSIHKAKIGFIDKICVVLVTMVSAPIKYYITNKQCQ